MASKDQAIGAIIFLICFIIAILYIIGLFYFGGVATAGEAWKGWTLAFWLIAIPVFLALILVLGIGAWIGWTMATTPPPKPIEEIEAEEKKEEEKKEEEKAEEKE